MKGNISSLCGLTLTAATRENLFLYFRDLRKNINWRKRSKLFSSGAMVADLSADVLDNKTEAMME